MKKIYLTAMAGILMLSFNLVNAQVSPSCPSAHATYYNLGSNCVVFVDGMTPDADIVLLDPTLHIIGQAHTGLDGFAVILFDCSSSPSRVVALTDQNCYTLVPPQAILPVKLTSFNAELKSDNSVGLKWVSSLELSSFKYVVQKSNDGLNFSDIGSVNAAGNSDKPLNYAFSDNNFTSGASYFRLKQVDIDGKVEYSKIVYVNNRGVAGIITKVTPNPFTTDVQLIGISSAELNSKNVQLYNSFGQQVRYRVSGSNAIEIDPSAARGVYILKVKAQTFKLVKN